MMEFAKNTFSLINNSLLCEKIKPLYFGRKISENSENRMS
jgi:hypothetical protein